jgi:hypothetical protein
MFVINAENTNIEPEMKDFLFCNLIFPLPKLEYRDVKEEDICLDFTNSNLRFSSMKVSLYGKSILLNKIDNPLTQAILNPKHEKDFDPFFQNLFNQLFSCFKLPYSCVRVKLDGPVFMIKKKIGNKERVILFVQVKADKERVSGENEVNNYSVDLLIMEKDRFFVLSMVCSLNKFAFFCTFRLNNSFAFIQLTQYDNFSFGSNGLGLLKLLYFLELPWPIYGSLIINKEGIINVWKQKKLLGFGASADVYEYTDDNGNSKVIKFFKSFCSNQFFKEVYIYQCLRKYDISLKMEWYNSHRLVICTNEVGKEINLNQINAKAVKELYNSLQLFHSITGFIHKDIYYRNILQSNSNKNKLFLNDFGLADIRDELSLIKGNPFFASNRVL